MQHNLWPSDHSRHELARDLAKVYAVSHVKDLHLPPLRASDNRGTHDIAIGLALIVLLLFGLAPWVAMLVMWWGE